MEATTPMIQSHGHSLSLCALTLATSQPVLSRWKRSRSSPAEDTSPGDRI
jgi:hypothetical protein